MNAIARVGHPESAGLFSVGCQLISPAVPSSLSVEQFFSAALDVGDHTVLRWIGEDSRGADWSVTVEVKKHIISKCFPVTTVVSCHVNV